MKPEFVKALLEMQRVIQGKTFAKNKKAAYGKYLTLDGLLDQVLPILHEHGFVLVQGGGPDDTLITDLIHEHGMISSSMSLVMPTNKTAQSQGSAITYARRYSLLCMLGIMPDDDDDGAAASPKPTTSTLKSKNSNS